MMHKEEKVKKIIPSKLETGLQRFLYRTIGEKLPEWMTPNQITLIGALGGLFGIICALLVRVSVFFLIGTILGLICHLVCDDLDGYVARKRNMTSTAGGFFDLLTDILHITFLIIAMALSGVVSWQVAIFLVPVYALMMFTAMNYILYLKEFLFPRLGPIETHLFFVAVCVGTMILGTEPVFMVGSLGLRLADLIGILGGIPMYYELVRLQIQLFQRLDAKDKEDRKEQ